MRIFSKQESIVLILIFLSIFFISLFNFQIALKRGRDNARKNDLSDIASALDAYHTKLNAYPTNLDELSSFMRVVPKDPSTPSGYTYLYITNGRFFQIYASLEGGSDDSEYNAKIESRNLKCGQFVCSFGRASGNTPLDKSLEEYENEINATKKKGIYNN